MTAVTNTRVLHLWSTRSSASRPLDRTTARSTDDDARRTTTTTNDDDERGEPDSPLAPAFRTSRAPVHAPASTRSRSTNDDDEASERSLETERNATRRPRERDVPSLPLPRFEPRGSEQEEENRTKQNRTDRSR